ncbi:hypothetical protein [Azospirillum isscasi]|uniref:Rap1a immunity protein domain-containing protein n=1 Tax=Azospirillum isscasi TaxID=3053926 RepID=A0ABU0WQR3_9PROT|nr:hypothetical protein [Azospirillum isscasi]MDQ2106585.1 hypothetical protein [Azospirillum isscasi]
MTRTVAPVALLALLAGFGTARAEEGYPTYARVDYVLGCMVSNGQGPDVVRKCSCSIDEIAAHFPYDSYVAMETARSMQDAPGERASLMRDVGWIKDLLNEFRQVQVAADLKCF